MAGTNGATPPRPARRRVEVKPEPAIVADHRGHASADLDVAAELGGGAALGLAVLGVLALGALIALVALP